MSEHDGIGTKYTALYIGTVVDNVDPDILGRVRINVPGLLEPASGWAYPLGTLGGGSAQRGIWWIPEVGAEVGVLFASGNIDVPYYLSAQWGVPGGVSEVPSPIADVSADDAHRVRCLEGERYLISIDEREGKESLTLIDKVMGDRVQLNGATGTVVVFGSTQVAIQTSGLIQLQGAQVQIQGRAVVPNGKPIQ